MDRIESESKTICRLCDSSDVMMHSIFDKISGGKQILQIIKDCLPILIYRTDPLSKHICNVCYNSLLNFTLFKKNSIENCKKQSEQLKPTNDTRVQLFLNVLNCDNVSCEPVEITPTKCTASQTDEIDLNQLQRAIEKFASPQRLNSPDESILKDLKENGVIENGFNESTSRTRSQKRSLNNSDSPPQKKSRIIGTRSNTLKSSQPIHYKPITLLKACLNTINLINVPDFKAEYSETLTHSDTICKLCNKQFKDADALAKHETTHKAKQENDEERKKSEVILVGTKAMVNGTLLRSIPKEQRRYLYKSVFLEGCRRKFCPLCRYIFKDNWSIELHYFSSACYYTCRFCGFRFNSSRSRHQFDAHINSHVSAGDEPPYGCVYVSKKGQEHPRIVEASKMTPRTMRLHRYKEEPVSVPTPVANEITEITESPENNRTRSQAYFCRKCYKVFFQVEEYNQHVIACKSGVKTSAKGRVSTEAAHASSKPETKPNTRSRKSVNDERAEMLSPSGRPVRNCVKEAGAYLDDAPEEVLEKMRRPQKLFNCEKCNSSFSTVYSRNSHMRVHKDDLADKKPLTRPRRSTSKKPAYDSDDEDDIDVKQEPIEPLVEIHESSNPYSTNIGSVSITPIPNANKRTNLDPSIIKLVQNNPNLTIKTMADKMREREENFDGGSTTESPATSHDDKQVKCSGCLKFFANKSVLYHHKKNCGNNKYPCPFCKKKLNTESAYSAHIFYNHAE